AYEAGATSYVGLSPCCCVQNRRQPLLNSVGASVPNSPLTVGSPLDTWMPVISLSPSLPVVCSASNVADGSRPSARKRTGLSCVLVTSITYPESSALRWVWSPSP